MCRWRAGGHVAAIEGRAPRGIIVHRPSSPAALEAGLVDPATRLAFDRSHPEQLAGLLDDVLVDDDMVYMPVSEVLLGKALDRIPMRVSAKEHPRASEARRVWVETRACLRSMQRSVVMGIKNQNRVEFERAGVVADTEIPDNNLDILL